VDFKGDKYEIASRRGLLVCACLLPDDTRFRRGGGIDD
jgi:hypothetical protein